MKKLVLTAILAAMAISAVTAIEATVISAKGKVEVQDGDAWKALAIGDSLKKGSIIQTGFKSELVLKIKESTVSVAPLSRVTIEQLTDKGTKDDTRVFLDTGSLKANVKKVENRRVGFTVKSPVATASVRGTIIGAAIGFQSTIFDAYQGSFATWLESHDGAEIEEDEEVVTNLDGESVAGGEEGGVAKGAGAGEGAGAEENAPAEEEKPAEREISASPKTTTETVSDGLAPKNSFLVSAGQSAGFNENGSTEKPETKAANDAIGMGSGTQTAAATNAVSMGGPADNPPAALTPIETPSSSTGSVICTFKWNIKQ